MMCADDSGAKVFNVISVFFKQGTKNRIPSGGVGDVMLVSVRRGLPKIRKQFKLAIIIRQKKPWRRMDGTIISCEDNAAVCVTPYGKWF